MIEKDLLDIIKREVEKYLKTKIPSKEIIKLLGTDNILKEELEKDFTFSNDSKKIIVSNLKISELVALGNGTFSNEKDEEILNHILNGDEVFLIKEGLEWRSYKNIPGKLLEKYENYENMLKDYGIKFFNKIEIIDFLKNASNQYSFNKKVLNLSDIKKLKEKEIIISEKTIITQLAIDYIKENNIKIIKRG